MREDSRHEVVTAGSWSLSIGEAKLVVQAMLATSIAFMEALSACPISTAN
jgi:hypothetical protein